MIKKYIRKIHTRRQRNEIKLKNIYILKPRDNRALRRVLKTPCSFTFISLKKNI